jgi:hypothetical protein
MAVKIEWIPYNRQAKLPLERRNVLVMIEKRQSESQRRAYKEFGRPGVDDPNFKNTAATVAVGYIRVHSGGPFFVVPGVEHKDEEITHWADCLGDDFTAPAWHSKQVIGEPRRQWDNHRGHINEVTSAERFANNH